MNFLFRIFFVAAAIVAVGFVLWFSLTLFALLFILGAGMVAFYAIKNFLIAKDILNPTPGVPMTGQPETTVTIIEGDYERVTLEGKKSD